MKVYISGTLDDPRITDIADGQQIPYILRTLGHRVVSQWHLSGVSESATGNYDDIDQADFVLAVVLKGHRHQGLHAEVGYAIGTCKPVFLLGSPSDVNLMLRHPCVTPINNIYDLVFLVGRNPGA